MDSFRLSQQRQIRNFQSPFQLNHKQLLDEKKQCGRSGLSWAPVSETPTEIGLVEEAKIVKFMENIVSSLPATSYHHIPYLQEQVEDPDQNAI